MTLGAKHNFRMLLFLVQQGDCALCGKPMSFTRRKNGAPARDFATFEHLDRREDGGQMNAANIVLSHYICNIKRDREYRAVHR